MTDLTIMKYQNLFPSELSRIEHFLLCLIHFSCPFHRNSLLYLLKPFAGDDEAAAILKKLVETQYLYRSDTGLGTFYAITAKTAAFLDIEHAQNPHRKQKVSDRMLLTYWLQSYIISTTLFNFITPICTELKHFPRNKKEKELVVSKMTQFILNKQVPLVDGYNAQLYNSFTSTTLKNLRIYDAMQSGISKLSAQLNAASIRARTDTSAAAEYLSLDNDLTSLKAELQTIIPKSQSLTYKNGLKVLSLNILQQNGIFIENIQDNMMSVGLLNNVLGGVSAKRIAMRLDYIQSLAESLGMTPYINLYTLHRDRMVLQKRIERLKLPFVLPTISYQEIPDGVPSRSELFNRISHQYDAAEE